MQLCRCGKCSHMYELSCKRHSCDCCSYDCVDKYNSSKGGFH